MALDKTRIVNSKINRMSHLIVFSLHGILSEVNKKIRPQLASKGTSSETVINRFFSFFFPQKKDAVDDDNPF